MIHPGKIKKIYSTPIDTDALIAGTARLNIEQAMTLYREASLHDLGRWATAVADRKIAEAYPEVPGVRTYVIDRNINYTNVCSARCTFCAFRRDGDEHDAYTLTENELHEKIRELVDIGGTQILLQGGMHPDLPLSFYEDMLRNIKTKFPSIHIHGFSPPEFVEFVAVCEIDNFPTTKPGKGHELGENVWQEKLEAIMRRLIAAGLDSLPGGGGEIFAPHVRRRLASGKADAKQWLDTMSAGHRLGMHTSATMMFGHIEGVADRFNHMQQIRDRQDLAIAEGWPGRYVSFISWPFQRENTPLGRLPDFDRERNEPFPGDTLGDLVASGKLDGMDKAACDQAVPTAGKSVRMAGASEYLRMQAISRLFFDNIHSIGSSWVTMGPRIGQLGLYFGATDMGSVMMEENVVSAAGTTYCLDEPVICQLIRASGYTPAQRDNRYQLLATHTGPSAPDRQVEDWSKHRVKTLQQQNAAVELTVTNG